MKIKPRRKHSTIHRLKSQWRGRMRKLWGHVWRQNISPPFPLTSLEKLLSILKCYLFSGEEHDPNPINTSG